MRITNCVRRVQACLNRVLFETFRFLRPSRRLGERGERAACRYLRRKGWVIVARQVHTSWGEIDIVAVEGRTVVFVEVKTRTLLRGDHPFDAIDTGKQLRLTRAAAAYLQRHDLLDCASRFDAVAVIWPAGMRRPKLEHVRNAFAPQEAGSMFF